MQAQALTALFGDEAFPAEQIEEIVDYCAHCYELPESETPMPLADEPFLEIWREWDQEAQEIGAFRVLARHLPQFRFPIEEGQKDSKAYRAATLSGVDLDSIPEATGLKLQRPDLLELVLHPSPAGRIPLLIHRRRADFEDLLRALARRNEPAPVPPGQGASMIAGYNNWVRIHALKKAWEKTPESERETANWPEEFARIRADKSSYQDRFILLSDGPYSGVPAEDLGIGEDEWRELSLIIRREHECAHYLTRRLFGGMRNHLLDELLADYAGLTAATGRFQADWFLRFLGLDLRGSEESPTLLEGARIEIYRGDPPLSDGAFRGVQRLIIRAARAVEELDREIRPVAESERSLTEKATMIATSASLTLLEIAAEDGLEKLRQAHAAAQSIFVDAS